MVVVAAVVVTVVVVAVVVVVVDVVVVWKMIVITSSKSMLVTPKTCTRGSLLLVLQRNRLNLDHHLPSSICLFVRVLFQPFCLVC